MYLGKIFYFTMTTRLDCTVNLVYFSPSPNVCTFLILSFQRQLYILKVAAHDGGNPSRSTTTLVYMNVLDVNDNQPVFDPASYAQQVFENVGVGFTVINVSATDIDSGKMIIFFFLKKAFSEPVEFGVCLMECFGVKQ